MKILIIGLGSIAQKHIFAINKLISNPEIYAFRSGNKKGNDFGIKEINNVLDPGFTPNFVIISNPTYLHYETIQLVYKKGWPLFIEKPLFHTLRNTEKLINEIIVKKTKCYIACNLRFHPSLVYLKNFFKKYKPIINEVNAYCGSYLPNWRPKIDYKKNYSAFKEKGGGVHLDLIHEIDYLYWLFGEPINIKSIHSKKSRLSISSFDFSDYLLEYNDFFVGIRLNYYRRDSKRTLEIVTDKLTIFVDLLKGEVTNSNGEVLFYKPFDIMNTYFDQMKYFINFVLNNNNYFNNIEEAYKVLNICLYNDEIKK